MGGSGGCHLGDRGAEGEGGSASGTARVRRHKREQGPKKKKNTLLLGSWEENDRRRETKLCLKEAEEEEGGSGGFGVCARQNLRSHGNTQTCHRVTSSQRASQLPTAR